MFWDFYRPPYGVRRRLCFQFVCPQGGGPKNVFSQNFCLNIFQIFTNFFFSFFWARKKKFWGDFFFWAPEVEPEVNQPEVDPEGGGAGSTPLAVTQEDFLVV